MKTILFIIQKEFKQIFRDKSMLRLILILPILQLLILSNAATFDVKNIAITFVDNDQSTDSRALINSFTASSYFNVTNSYFSEKEALEEIQKGKTDIVINIPAKFSQRLQKEKKASVSVSINAIDAATAGVENVYISQILNSYNQNIQLTSNYSATDKEIAQNITVIPYSENISEILVKAIEPVVIYNISIDENTNQIELTASVNKTKAISSH